MKLEQFLERIYSLSDGSCAPVLIYEYDSNFYPDKAQDYDGFMGLFKSNFVPRVTMSDRLLNAEVMEIYWTENGIAVTVMEQKQEGKQ